MGVWTVSGYVGEAGRWDVEDLESKFGVHGKCGSIGCNLLMKGLADNVHQGPLVTDATAL